MSFQDADDLKVICDYCGQKVRIPAGFTRQRFRCPACHRRIRVERGPLIQRLARRYAQPVIIFLVIAAIALVIALLGFKVGWFEATVVVVASIVVAAVVHKVFEAVQERAE
jgi:uncharacterized paraquat-inducible protein A